MDYSTCIYDSSDMVVVGNQARFTVDFFDEGIKYPVQIVFSVPTNSDLNFNGTITFNIPNGNRAILFVAVHKELQSAEVMSLIQRSSGNAGSIPSNWWVLEP